MLPALEALASTEAHKAADPSVSWGPLAFDGLDADEAQRFLWTLTERASSLGGLPRLTAGGREVGQILEVAQWPFPVDGVPDRTVFACVRWTDPAAATSPDLALAGQRVRVIGG